MRELKFVNQDATPKTVILTVSTESISPIMNWYGAYYAKDIYKVFVDNKLVKKDQNGQLVGDIPNG